MAALIRGLVQMARGLTIAAIAIAILMLVLFGLDLAVGMPFGKQSLLMDICFIVCGLGLGLLGISTWRELD